MTTPDEIVANKTAVWRLVEEGFNSGDLGVTEEICDPTCVNPSSIIAVPQGARSIGVHIQNAQASMKPGSGLRILDAVGAGDEVALTWRTSGQGGSRYLGVESPDNDGGSAWVIGFWRFNGAGRLVRWDAAWEPMRLLANVGFFDPIIKAAEDRATDPLFKVANVGMIGDLDVPRSRYFPDLPTREQVVEYQAPDAGRPDQVRSMMAALLTAEFTGKSGVAGEHLSPACQCSYADYAHSVGPSGFESRASDFARAFSDASIEIDRFVAEQNRCAATWKIAAVHTGEFLGLEPSGRDVCVSGAVTVELDGDRITRWIEVFDILTLLRQLAGLGAMVPAAYQSFSI
jgi:predicted ester cyclase